MSKGLLFSECFVGNAISITGYMYHAASGYYYDANTGLYFDTATQQWKGYDAASGQYLAVGGEPAVSTAAEAAIGNPIPHSPSIFPCRLCSC
jgi:hypothetical protein